MNPQISIIVPCYNAVPYIDRCVNSLVNQTIGLENLEIILVNDASTDSTYEKLLDWEQQYPDSILVINSTENLRQGGARNLGVSYARGTYLAFVDADDWVEPDMYQKMTEKAVVYDCDLVSCNFDRPTSDGTVLPGSDFPEHLYDIKTTEERADYLLSRLTATMAPLSIYKRNWYQSHNISFPEKLLYEDHILFFVYAVADRIYALNEKLYHYYKNETSVTSTCKNPFDRIPVHQLLYSRFATPEFSNIKDIVDYNFYQKAIAETVFCDPAILSDISTVQDLKKMLFDYVPDILKNPYFCSDISIQNISLELLLRPLIKNEITTENFSLFLKRVLYCIEFPDVLFFVEQLGHIQRRLEQLLLSQSLSSNALSEISESVNELCSTYCTMPYAQSAIISKFTEQTTRLYGDVTQANELLALIDALKVCITLPTGS